MADVARIERQLRAAERDLATELRLGESAPTPFTALKCERLLRTVDALRRRRAGLLADHAARRPHHVPVTLGRGSDRFADRNRASDRFVDLNDENAPLPANWRPSREPEVWAAQAGSGRDTWGWKGRTIRVVKHVLDTDAKVAQSLLRRAAALERRIRELERERRRTPPTDDNEIDEERLRAREAAREHLQQRAAALRIELEHNSAVAVQSVLRGHLGRRKMRQARDKYDAAIREQGAIALQATFRGHLARQHLRARMVEEDKATQQAAAQVIQSQVRGRIARQQLRGARSASERRKAAATVLQAWWRGCVARAQVHETRQQHRAEAESLAALMVQCAWRGFVARRERTRLAREREQARQEAAAIMLQAAWRGRSARRRVKQIRAELRSMEHDGYIKRLRQAVMARDNERQRALQIQAATRGFLTRKQFSKLRAKRVRQMREDAEVERLLQEQKEETEQVAKLVFEGSVSMIVDDMAGQRSRTGVRVSVREVRSPYQLKVRAKELSSGVVFKRRIDLAVLEQLLTPLFEQEEHERSGEALASGSDPLDPVRNWVLNGRPPRRQQLISWVVERMWLDVLPDGELELCLGASSADLGSTRLDKSLSAAIPPGSPKHGRTKHAHDSHSPGPQAIPSSSSGRVRDSFVVRYAAGSRAADGR